MPDYAEPTRQPRLGRRNLIRGAGVGVFGVASIAVLPLFGTDGAAQDPATCVAKDVSATDKKLIVSNWPAYIDPRADGPTNTRDVFEDETGITVKYTDDVNDNAEFFAKVRNQLGSCETVKRDMFMLTDWMAARMIALGWIQPLDAANVPNLHDNLIKPLRGRRGTRTGPLRAVAVGLTGIAYNSAATDAFGSFEELLTRSDLTGKITLLSEMRDTMGFMLKVTGADPSDFTEDEWANAIDRLAVAVDAGQVRSFTGNEYIQDLAAGNIVACEAWSGDVIQAQFDNPDIKFVTPEEGLSIWSDNMLVPNLATHQANAEKWIDYYYRPDVAAKLAAWVNYICPVEGAREEMEKIDPSLVDNQLIFPDEDTLSKTFDFMALDENQIKQYEGDWSDVTGG